MTREEYSRFDPRDIDGSLHDRVFAAVDSPAFGPVDIADTADTDRDYDVRVTPRDGPELDRERVPRVADGLRICGFEARVSDDEEGVCVFGLREDA